MKKPFVLFTAVSLSALLAACSNMSHDAPPHNQNMSQDWKADHEQHMNMMTEYFFDKMDANGDGVITWKEFMNYQREKFHEADTNHDGKLTLDEVKAEAKREHHEVMEWKKSQREENQNDNDNASQHEMNYEGAPGSNMNQGSRY